jgi:hypothetical protein
MTCSLTDKSTTYSQVKSPPKQTRVLFVHPSKRLQGTLSQLTTISHTKTEAAIQNKKRTNLPIQALKLPHTVSLIINLIPPAQPNQNPAADILHHPEVKCGKEHSDHEDDDKALHEEREQDVEGQCCRLGTNTSINKSYNTTFFLRNTTQPIDST